MPEKTLVILANSKKYLNRCVAGVELGTETWVRPLGSGGHGGVTLAEQRLDDGNEPALLDVVELQVGEAAPQPGQPENWQLAPGQWRRVGHLDSADARQLLTGLATADPLFGTNARSIPTARVEAGDVAASLAVVHPEDLSWEKRTGFTGGTQVRGKFRHAGVWHNLPLTDPAFLPQFANFELGEYAHAASEDVFLVISLGEPMNDEHWKLIAGVIGLPR